MRDLALEQLKSGKSLTGKVGILAPIQKELLCICSMLVKSVVNLISYLNNFKAKRYS